MVSDNQVRHLMKLKRNEESLKLSSLKSGMSEKTARNYFKNSKLPRECRSQMNKIIYQG